MVQTIRTQFRLQWENEIMSLLFLLGGMAVGEVLLVILFRFGENVGSYVAAGTILAGFMGILYRIITLCLGMNYSFGLEISVGCTRRQFFVSYYIEAFCGMLKDLAILILIALAENAVCAWLITDRENSVNLVPYLLRWGVPVCVLTVTLAGFCGALVMRFGKLASWSIWIFWMAVCIGTPNITDLMQEAPDSALGRFGNSFAGILQKIPWQYWPVYLAIASVLFIGGAYAIVRKQQVTV